MYCYLFRVPDSLASADHANDVWCMVRRRRRRRARAEVDRQLQLLGIEYNADSDRSRSTDLEELNDSNESSSENDIHNEANENIDNDNDLNYNDQNEVNGNSDNSGNDDNNLIYNEVHDIPQNFDVQSSSEDSDNSLVFHEILQENGHNFDNDEDREQYLLRSLSSWAMRGVSLIKVDSLLKLLSPLHPRLPLTHSALLGTPHANNIREMGSGQFWYKGITKNLQQRITQNYLENHEKIVCDINIDGLPPYKYSYDKIWPILGRLVDQDEPFIIVAHRGKSKPDDVNTYLEAYVQEARELIENGIEYETTSWMPLPDPLSNVLLGIMGLFLEKNVEAVHVLNTQTYVNLLAPLRDDQGADQSFLERRNALHHTGDSPLEQIPTAMVSSFRLDPLHIVYLGVVKRWLNFVVGTTKRRGILDRDQVKTLNLRLQELKEFVPRDFSRRPRPFQEKAKFRATEMRRILLYNGLALLYDLPPQLWRSFTLLHAFMYVLCCPSLVGREDMRNIAKILIQRFITHSVRHVGPHFPVYNVQALYQLPEECALYGTLENFSTFVFENGSGTFRPIRFTQNHLTQ
ncbi:LOW QUALITY PROTEIN: hypothetical protein KUF71_007313 [Frankliniella fusca]|uniref:Uncharacterized protein n=1 Tax=Frankliniella fusca TaxID=407009 RepID=A0AAE1HBV1_9NEOP|nr:LOW QUALITY PROTEIN: hypothetical protein KUF71_007313 [Frankliniella fusca]